uniref:Putative ovule protein n=1 Tax=Solanum chacoense TaxID=4108 RepID=A0A0V0HUV1_SOLCH
MNLLFMREIYVLFHTLERMTRMNIQFLGLGSFDNYGCGMEGSRLGIYPKGPDKFSTAVNHKAILKF